ncbi:MAG: amino acid permease [Candidatus Eremiobacteraeota bacterium]|nr:amino acid permease [Candidatus Eremiobacteraeota bacterium]
MTLLRRLFVTQPHDSTRSGEGPPLRRALGVPSLICVGLGTMLGGIFAAIGVGTLKAGPGVIASFLLSGLACFFVSLCYAELASMVPIAGSAYTYAYATLGEIVAWVIGWDLILEYGVSVAPIAASWSGTLQLKLADAHITLPQWAQVAHLSFSHGSLDMVHSQVDVLAIAIVVFLTALLAIGIRESAGANTTLVIVQVVAIVIFIGGLVGAIHPQNFHPSFPHGMPGVVAGAAAAFFAYIGFDTVTVASEEARRPARDVPIAVVGSLLLGAVLYIGIAWVTVGVVPWAHIDPNAGMTDAVRRAGNNPFVAWVTFIAVMAGTTTVMLTSLLGQIRIFYVMARDRMLPPAVARVNRLTATPLVPTIVVGLIVAILAGIVPIDIGIALTNIGTLSAFTIVCAGVFVLRTTKPFVDRPFRAPLGKVTAVIGAALCLYLMIGGLSGGTWLRFIIWFAVGMVFYVLYGYRHSLLNQPESRARTGGIV